MPELPESLELRQILDLMLEMSELLELWQILEITTGCCLGAEFLQ